VVNYFPTLTPRPQRQTLEPGADATTLAGRLTNQVVVDSKCNVVLANSQAGTTGNLAAPHAAAPGAGPA